MSKMDLATYRETYRQRWTPGDIVTLWTGDLDTYKKVCMTYSSCIVTLWDGNVLLRERDSYLNGLRANMETIF